MADEPADEKATAKVEPQVRPQPSGTVISIAPNAQLAASGTSYPPNTELRVVLVPRADEDAQSETTVKTDESGSFETDFFKVNAAGIYTALVYDGPKQLSSFDLQVT